MKAFLGHVEITVGETISLHKPGFKIKMTDDSRLEVIHAKKCT